MLPLRSVTAIIVQLPLLNIHAKKLLWDDISSKEVKVLSIRVIFGFVASSALIYVTKTLPLVLVALITNIMPLFTAIFGRIFLKEKLTSL